MIEVEIQHAEPTAVAFIQMAGIYDQIPDGYRILYSWIQSRGYTAVGAPRAVYVTPPEEPPIDHATWELQAPLEGDPPEMSADARGLGVKNVPATIYAVAVHKGPYETIQPTYEALQQWVVDNGYEMAGPPEELYLTSPRNTEPNDYLTRVRFPVVKKWAPGRE